MDEGESSGVQAPLHPGARESTSESLSSGRFAFDKLPGFRKPICSLRRPPAHPNPGRAMRASSLSLPRLGLM